MPSSLSSDSRPSWDQRVPACSTSPTGLVDDLSEEGVYRLGFFALVGVSVWLITLVLYRYLIPAAGADAVLTLDQADGIACRSWSHWVNWAGVGAGLLMFGLTRKCPICATKLLNIGMAYFVLTGALIAIGNSYYHVSDAGDLRMKGISWVCVWILAYPMAVPTARMRIFIAALLVAAADPLFAFLRAHAITGAWPGAGALYAYAPNLICAFLAILPAHIVYKMGRKLNRARKMGSYELVKRIGQGGMGEVWEAKHRFLARPAAVKIIRGDQLKLNASEEDTHRVLRRFEREAQATAALESPHTIQIFDFGLSRNGTFYYVMELLDGFNLDTFVRKFGPMDSARVILIMRQICDSLQDAHAKGLIHRDIKPANIFLCRRGLNEDYAKVLDFGLVKNDPSINMQDSLATTEMTTGTPAFMAPEQASAAGTVDARTDLYALGCVAYWLVTGRLVFEAKSPIEMLVAHMRDEVVPPSQLSETEIDSNLEELILDCLRKDPAKRPGSAREVAARLSVCEASAKWSTVQAVRWWDRHAPAGARALTLSPALEVTAPA
jgi:serine/threonine-protein kinase